METLLELDRTITLAINGAWSTALDPVMKFVSEVYVWVPLYLAVIAWFFWKMPWKKALVCVIVVVAAFAFTDMFSNFLKNDVFMRPRPRVALAGTIRNITGETGGCGFPSGHACNTLCFAILTSWIIKRKWWTPAILAWSLIISYSRIYLAAHYFGDVLAGFVLGGVTALAAIGLLKLIFKFLPEKCSA